MVNRLDDIGNPIDCDHTSDVMCPWCGYANDPTNYLAKDGTYYSESNCTECGKEFLYRMHVEVTFSTKKKEAPRGD